MSGSESDPTDRADAWRRTKQVLANALDRSPDERAVFLDNVCSADPALRADVESLLAAHTASGSFAEHPPLQAFAESENTAPGDVAAGAWRLQPGDRLGPYRIEAPLGSGGMGQVYKATDSRLHRDVAIKILPPDIRVDPHLRQRFDREARAIAALRHPHVCILYDVGHEGVVDFLVMEYLEGESLAERLAAAPLPLAQVLRYASDLAEALAEMHSQGIVHRDLKPANIMLTTAGAKLLDFGTAKRQVSVASRTEGATTDSLTAPANIIGTLHYMAPEQLEGQPDVDARTDIFAFGAVLYEMVTGKKAFDAASQAGVVAAILEREPTPIAKGGVAAPPALERLILKCIRKHPDERCQRTGEIVDELRQITSNCHRHGEWMRTLVLGKSAVASTVAVFVVLVGAALFWRSGAAATFLGRVGGAHSHAALQPGEGQPPLAIGNLHQLTPGDDLEIDPSLSPDGKFVAYSAGNANQMRVFIRSTSGGHSIQLTDEPSALEYQPRWSPDGNDIVYITRQGAFVTPAFGGTPRRVDSSTNDAGLYAGEHLDIRVTDAVWSPEGQRLAIAHGGVLSVIARDGSGRERVLTRMNADLHHCSWSSDGQWIACTAGNWRFAGMSGLLGTIAPSQIVIIPARGGSPIEVTDLKAANQSAAWAPDSRHLYFVSDRRGGFDVYGVEISRDGHATDEPVRVTTGLGVYSISFGADGKRLAYTAYASRANVWSLEIPSKGAVNITGAQPLTHGNQITEAMRVSVDGKWLVYDATVDGNADIYRVPISGGPVERLTTHSAGDFAPVLSPDGRLLAYHSWRTQTRDIFVQPLDGGPVEQVTSTPAQECYPVWLPDSRSLMFRDLNAHDGIHWFFLTRREVPGRWSLPEHLEFIDGIAGFDWMPDGRRLAYVAGHTVGLLHWMSKSRQQLYSSAPNSTDPIPDSVRSDRIGNLVYIKSHDKQGTTSFWSIPATGGRPSLLVKFDDPMRQSGRFDFDVDAKHFYFTIEERHSNVWVADVTER